ncbi:MAG: hypothetical protein A3A98_03845 [Candidatus Staskawiczbacteria bacterium RIFCSPLOWO2_01_FULL_40_39]|uniref:NYN domain-containing protein n=1 Tax=Candidatus Staskawiczbacteria bacterium RIFCSPHIGHO2_01_FULL_39_25 TaxID=1802202 RepID=A0A1G2HP75_9BACT|nr:MAG: hypothetical protein A2730_03060 [Candidatus Staskawiczbacteria bacterium RIFCSPHIGHO2_01_FULL_39_25]OGZ73543.1 MAG: hypothetical protein A3A98_03845 [Candidatus Staskawiczbacteria bacterium RIFCSPLOWO2_01_FULL_40_39]
MQLSIIGDYENLRWAIQDKEAREKNPISMETVTGEIIEKGLALGEIHDFRFFIPAYFNGTSWRLINALMCKFGVKVEVCPVLTEQAGNLGGMKDAVDFAVLEWIKDHLHKNVAPKQIIFVSGDGHWIMSGNAAKMKDKKVQFWSLDSSNVHGTILRQEEFREVKIKASSTLLAGDNPFFQTLNKLIDGKEINGQDSANLKMMARIAQSDLNGSSETDDVSSLISTNLGISPKEALALLEALMALDIARIHPAIKRVINIDKSHHLFEWLQVYK